MSEPTAPTVEARLLRNLNSKQLELLSFYLSIKAKNGLSVEQLASEFEQQRVEADYYPSGFHVVNQLNELAECVERQGGDELARKLYDLIGELPSLLP